MGEEGMRISGKERMCMKLCVRDEKELGGFGGGGERRRRKCVGRWRGQLSHTWEM